MVKVIVESEARPALAPLPLSQGDAATDGSAVRIRSSQGVDTVVFCSRATGERIGTASPCTAADLETDAAFAWHHAPATGGRALAGFADGRTLRINGIPLLAARDTVALAEVP